jgi:hypothetical protein
MNQQKYNLFSRRGMLQTSGLAALGSIARRAETQRFQPFIGVQIAPYSLFDEGIEHCLDLLKNTAQINALVLYTHNYYGALGRPPEVLAPDHGVPVRDERKRKLPRAWIRHREEFYQDTPLRHQVIDSSYEYHDRDLFTELVKPAQERGIEIFARILEPQASNGIGKIINWETVLTKDIDGKRGRGPCWNHPHYREWILATVCDMFTHYRLDGIQYGSERVGPLSEVLYRGTIPTCFCEHCVNSNKEKNIDAERARTGYRNLYELMQQVSKRDLPTDGVFTSVLRIMQQYHEVLAWNYQWLQADEEIGRLVYDAIKTIKPNAQVGRHVDHQRSSWDIFYRAAVSYGDMAKCADFIKPILYHDILGPRLRWWVLDRMKDRILGDLTLEQSLDLFYSVMNLNSDLEPSLNELNDQGMSPDYVYRETKRAVDGVEGSAAIYSGIGFDVPWHSPKGQVHFPSAPEQVYQATLRAFEAGAQGIVASREYSEMRVNNLKAIGKAVSELNF